MIIIIIRGVDENDGGHDSEPEDEPIDTSVTIRTMGITTAPEGTRYNQVTVQPTVGAHLEHSIGTEDITEDMIETIAVNPTGIENIVNIVQELPTGQGDYINESTLTTLKIGKYSFQQNGLKLIEKDANNNYIFPVAIDVNVPQIQPSENTLNYSDLEREYNDDTGQWLEPGDVELTNEQGQVTATLDVSDAAIYPRGRFIKKENVVIEYDGTNQKYFAKQTYDYPVTKAEFEFDMNNSTIPVPQLESGQVCRQNRQYWIYNSDQDQPVEIEPNAPQQQRLRLTETKDSVRAGEDLIGSFTVDVPANVTTKTITTNGTYNASSDNVDGYSTVTVNVPNPAPYTVNTAFDLENSRFELGISLNDDWGMITKNNDSSPYNGSQLIGTGQPYGLLVTMVFIINTTEKWWYFSINAPTYITSTSTITFRNNSTEYDMYFYTNCKGIDSIEGGKYTLIYYDYDYNKLYEFLYQRSVNVTPEQNLIISSDSISTNYHYRKGYFNTDHCPVLNNALS